MPAGPGPLLYKGAPRWQILAALGGAILIHAAAVALAYKREPPPADATPELANTVEAVIETQPPEDLPTPPPEDIPLPPPPPDVPQVQEFHEEQTPPPQKQRPPTKPQAPIKAPQQTGPPRPPGTLSAGAAKAAAISAPRPEYPYEAKRSKITGSGVCVLSVDAGGSVTDASMASSTGNAILDNAAISAFRRWRFKPGSASRVRIPITFTLTGASY